MLMRFMVKQGCVEYTQVYQLSTKGEGIVQQGYRTFGANFSVRWPENGDTQVTGADEAK